MNIGFIAVGFIGMNVWKVLTKRKTEMRNWDVQIYLISFSFCGGGLVNMLISGFHIW